MLILDSVCPRSSYSPSKSKIVEEGDKDRLPSKVRDSSRSMVRGMNEKDKGSREEKGDRNRCRENTIQVHWQDSERTGCTDTDTDDIFNDDGCPLVRAFGLRKYGMSQATWTLIILSRRCAEQVTMIILMKMITIMTMTVIMTMAMIMMMIMIIMIKMMMIFDS